MTMTDVVTRFLDGAIHAFDFPDGAVADSVAVFELPTGVEPDGHDVAPDLGRAVYATGDEVVCVDRAGKALWRWGFGPGSARRAASAANCRFSADGTEVWLYLPDAMAGRGPDRWVVLSAATGDLTAAAELACAGHGGSQFAHPDGVHVLLDVGEGQDGSQVYRGRLVPDGLDVAAYPWSDRSLVDLAPDGGHFMTVHHEQEDVAFHTHPDGEVVVRVPVESFGHDPEEVYVEWAGGYLDADTAIVVLGGETEDEEEWHRHHLVDVRTGEVRGTLDTPSRDAYDVEPRGDGSWLSTDDDGRPRRHTR
ncbi:hypothetical protein ABTZ99_28435 [Actinosynnema sp. NPDC002837]